MTDSFLFSVVILSYCSSKTWQAAVDSVLMQDYPSVELIFSDDGSKDFDRRAIETYISERAGENLHHFEVLSTEKNRGTVKNIIEAEQHCKGSFLIHFAADDAFANEKVLSHLAEKLLEKPKDVLGIYGQSIVCDADLLPSGGCSFDTSVATLMNSESSNQQWERLCSRCCIHFGATAFVREELLTEERYDSSFVLMEDWPFFLKATQVGFRFLYMDEPILLYRQGGVTAGEFTEGRRQLFKDHLHLYERYILPKSDMLKNTWKIWLRYLDDRKDAQKAYGELSSIGIKNLSEFSNRFYCIYSIWLLKRYRLVVVLSFVFILSLFIFIK